ncbi:hypothetical protein Psch_02187 [Pelotomaculum schinkii]|uniref:Uncharacterized protein n=1 Tax=Pelotomaculum schinkii TaxID=78350 RepID=A0A4Y7RIJ4_9FIRM|nr:MULTISPECIES: hypothetical protein [Pelotomaculum]TEB08621.1 hypothetical protein Psch_02187 [Pelotomaculum schinkii]TEB16816.1 hypothetical protein Psfp_00978 [Pelotomaculum sp. FP]
MKFIEIKLPKCTLFLLPDELNRLLQQDPDLFAKGIKRGKGILRARQAMERNCKHTSKEAR